jgi:RND family efflux transporter MFP subunit
MVTEAGTGAPRRRMIWAIGLIAVAGLAGLAWWQPWAARGLPVAVETVTPGPVSRVLAINGQIDARTSVAVHAAVTGTVVALLVDEGSVVAAGDVLARIDPAQQEASVRQAQAALQEGIVAQTQAGTVYGRARELGANVADAVREDARNALDRAAQEVDRLRAMLDQATILLDRYTVRAPQAGTVMERHFDPGQLVDPSVALFVLADLTDLIVRTDVDEAFATQITPGLPVILQLVGSSETQTGTVSFVSPRVDAATGGLAIRIDFDAPVNAPVGLTVTANIIVAEEDAAMTAPRSAIVATATGSSVFLAVDGVARATPVTVIDWPSDRLIVTEGLTAGDVLITAAAGVSDGAAIRVGGP